MHLYVGIIFIKTDCIKLKKQQYYRRFNTETSGAVGTVCHSLSFDFSHVEYNIFNLCVTKWNQNIDFFLINFLFI